MEYLSGRMLVLQSFCLEIILPSLGLAFFITYPLLWKKGRATVLSLFPQLRAKYIGNKETA